VERLEILLSPYLCEIIDSPKKGENDLLLFLTTTKIKNILMKKIYIFLFLLTAFAYVGNAQYLQADFEDGLPADWVAENVWAVGNAQSLSSDYFVFPEYTQFAGVNDDALGAAGNASGKLITADIDLTAGEHFIVTFDLFYFHANYNNAGQETFSVLYSEDGGTTWNRIHEMTQGSNWGPVLFTNSEMAGKTVKLAFEYADGNNWSYGAGIDNISVIDQPEFFALVGSPNPGFQKISAPDETASFEFPFTYMGFAEVTEFTYEYSVNGGEVISEVVNWNLTEGDVYTHEIAGFGLGEHMVNGKVIFSDTYSIEFETMVSVVPPIPFYAQDDTKGVAHDLHNTLASGQAVVIDFFASWCGPCEVSTPLINGVWDELGRGEEDFQVFGVTVEPGDDVAVVNGLGWGAEYPKFAYSAANELLWQIFNAEYGDNAIPTFIMICPDVDNPGFSDVVWSTVGWPSNGATQIKDAFADCDLSPVMQESFSAFEVFPNPFESQVQVSFEFEQEMNTAIYVTDNVGRKVVVLEKGTMIRQYNRSLDLNDLNPGVYYLTIETEKGKLVKKLFRI
jgi:thiol-disulfide isomerase/thioredoxin